MKILMIMTTKFGVTGISNAVVSFYDNLDKENFEVDFVFPNQPDKKFIEHTKRYESKVYWIPGRLKKTVSYLHKLDGIMKNENYDIVHVHGNSHTLFLELLIAKKNKVKIRIPHSHSTSTKYPLINKILEKPFKIYYTTGIACSKSAGEWMFDDSEYQIVYNGIDISNYAFDQNKREQLRKQLQILPEVKVIGQIGSFTKNKNQKYTINLFNELSKQRDDIKLILIGDGDELSELKSYVIKLGIQNNVQFLGLRNDVNDLLSVMDLLMMPSYYEGLPISLIESQASGLPALVSNNVSTEIKKSNLIEFFDLDTTLISTLQKVNELLNIEIERETLQVNASLNLSDFNATNATARLEEVYREAYNENMNRDDYN